MEKPKTRIIPINAEEYISGYKGVDVQDLYKEFQIKFSKAIAKAEEKLILEFAQELEVTTKCAKKFITSHMNIRVEIITPDSMVGTPSFKLVAEPKSVEQILMEIDAGVHETVDWECEKQLMDK